MAKQDFEEKYSNELKNHNLLQEFEPFLKREMEVAYEKSLRNEDHYFYFKGIKFLSPIWTEEGLKDQTGQLAYMIAMLRWAGLWIDCVNPENIENIKEVLNKKKSEK